jgi:hypothetical protein
MKPGAKFLDQELKAEYINLFTRHNMADRKQGAAVTGHFSVPLPCSIP